MKYRIKYLKKNKQYDFTITFKNLEHKLTKLAQYKLNAINFKAIELSYNKIDFKYIPYNNKSKSNKVNRDKTYIKSQG